MAIVKDSSDLEKYQDRTHAGWNIVELVSIWEWEARLIMLKLMKKGKRRTNVFKPEPQHHQNCPSNGKTWERQTKQTSNTFLATTLQVKTHRKTVTLLGNPTAKSI